MLRVGITGGIGSGKSTVCGIFEVFGIPVFYADDAARMLMDKDSELRTAIAGLLGTEVYLAGHLDRAAVSRAVFNNPDKLAALNALVHPAAVRAAERWLSVQRSPYAIKEAAIFFESGTHIGMDVMIGVSAPRELRIRRVITRSGITRGDVVARMEKQMDEAEKMARCDYVIVNDEKQPLLPQVFSIDSALKQASH